MKYFQGFVIPVRTDNKQAYLDMAKTIARIFADHGALRSVDCWGDDLMDGKVTDYKKAVQAADDETVVLSWVWWPDKAACDAVSAKIMADDRMKSGVQMPFDGRRLIYGGFDVSFDTGDGDGGPGYVDGMVASIPGGERWAFVDHSAKVAGLFQEKGALRVVDGWGTDVPAGKRTDFSRAVQAKDSETVLFGWIEWPDKATRDAGMGTLMQDPRMREAPPPWNAQLAIFGGFSPIFDSGKAQGGAA